MVLTRKQPVGFFDRTATGRVHPRTTAERHAARLTTAQNASDADDLRLLLDVLGLWPSGDAQLTVGPPAEPFVGRYRSRVQH